MNPPNPDFHEDIKREDKVIGPSNRSFGYTFAGVFLFVGALNIWKEHVAGVWWIGGAAFFFLLARFWPRPLTPLNAAWLRLGLLLHRIVSPVIMGLMFFAVMTPIGWIMRRLGHDLLSRRLDPSADSYWVVRPPRDSTTDSMKNQF